MHIAILGGTSEIAKDLARSFGKHGQYFLSIFARQPTIVQDWLRGSAGARFSVNTFDEFVKNNNKFDAIINFVGAGNPERVMSLGTEIFRITNEFDELALEYIKRNPRCRYVFASSGAVYGGDFSKPATFESRAAIQINNLPASSWYGVAKLYAECRHRALSDYSIVDVRFFNYFSSTQNINDRFLVTDALRAARDGVKFKTSPEQIVRDYMGPEEVFSLISCILSSESKNAAIDANTKQPVEKFQMLEAMRDNFGLSYEIDKGAKMINSTGIKINYYSKSQLAHELFGFSPQKTSLEVVLTQAEKILSCKNMASESTVSSQKALIAKQ